MTSVPYLGNNTYPQAASTIQDLVKKFFANEFGEEAELKVYREIHGCGGARAGAERPYGARVDQALYWWGHDPIRKIFSDDGVWDGDSLCDREADTGRARPSANTWGKMASHILLKYPYRLCGRDCLLNFEHLPKGGDVACQVATMRAISKAYCGRFGVWPANYGKHIYVPPSVSPSPPGPAPVKMWTCIGWLKTLSVKRWWKRVFAGGKKRLE